MGKNKGTNRREIIKATLGGTVLAGLGLSGASPLLAGSMGRRWDSSSSPIPFLSFELMGGAAFPGNFLAGGRGGALDLLPAEAYRTLGWDPRLPNAIDNSLGAPMARQVSSMLKGIKAYASPSTLKHFKLATICTQTRDDTSSNPLSLMPAIARLYGDPSLAFPNGLGTTNSNTGGKMAGIFSDASLKPFFVGDVDSLVEAGGVDPRSDSRLKDIFQLQAGAGMPAQHLERAASIVNTLVGKGLNACNALPSFDYHGRSIQEADRKDFEFGSLLGMSLEAAAYLNTPLFTHAVTDGGCLSGDGTHKWLADNGARSMIVIGYFDPRRDFSLRRSQIGRYTPQGSADTTTLVGRDVISASYAALINYLALNDALSLLEEVIPPDFFNEQQIASLIAFEAGAQ